ncbi:unnamed protein product [Alopecurus aequalis]
MAAAAADRNWALLPDDLIRDIFARVRPNDPLYIFQVHHLCKGWLQALSDPDFARRLREQNVLPLPVGFLHDRDDGRFPVFVPTVASPFCPIDHPDRRDWKVLDCRNGRSLFISTRDGELGRRELLIWDPVTGVRKRVPVPDEGHENKYPGAAVVCAAPGCNHRPGCSGGDFQVVLLFSDPAFPDFDVDGVDGEMKCFIYSSLIDTWTEVDSLPGIGEHFGDRPSLLAGNSFYFLSDGLILFEFDMCVHTLSQIDLPEMEERSAYREDTVVLVHAEDGGLGIVEATDGNIFIWSRVVKGDGDASWSLVKTFDHFDLHSEVGLDNHFLLGFAEGSNVIFLSTSQGIFTFELPSGLVKRVLDEEEFSFVLPVVSFYGPHNGLQEIESEQQHAHANHIEDPLQLAEDLFTKGCSDIENRDFNSAIKCLKYCLDIRTGHYGKFATECASTYYKYGCALLYKAQEVSNLSGEEGEVLGLSEEMLEIARSIVLRNLDNTVGISDIVSAMGEVLMQKEKKKESTETHTESTKRANVMPTCAEPSWKRQHKAADPVGVDRSPRDSGTHSSEP